MTREEILTIEKVAQWLNSISRQMIEAGETTPRQRIIKVSADNLQWIVEKYEKEENHD